MSDNRTPKPFKKLVDAMSPASRARGDAKAETLGAEMVIMQALNDCRDDGAGDPEWHRDDAVKILNALHKEGFMVVRRK